MIEVPGTRSDSLRTQAKIVATAERLFAARGIDSVSLSEINRAAGQGNKSAVHYHFGSKTGVLEAILSKHTSKIEAFREERLAALGPEPTERELVSPVVLSIVDRLDDVEGGGRDFVIMMAQAISHPTIRVVDRLVGTHAPPVARDVIGRLRAKSHHANEVFEHRIRNCACMMYGALAGRVIHEQAGTALGGRAGFVESLIDSACCVVFSPASAETLAFIDH